VNRYIKIIRLPNLLIIILTQYLFRICVIGTFYSLADSKPAFSEFEYALLVISTILIAAGGYVINDIFDLKTDEINKPKKMIVGKTISLRNAYNYYFILSISGLLAGFYLALKVNYLTLGFVYIAIVLLLYFYSDRYQKMVLLGNFITAFLSGMVIIIVWLFEFFALRQNTIIYTEVIKQLPVISILGFAYALFAFLVSLIREILKDAEDYEGDKEAGYQTFAVVFGVGRSKLLAIIFITAGILLMAASQYWLFANNFKLVFWYLTIAVQTLFLFLLFQTIKANDKSDYQFLSNASKIIMIAGILSMQLFYISF
jgi:4-hydroxybenzoate polyprenyltransferase